MSFARLITAGAFAAVTTAALILVMFKLVDRDWKEPEEKESFNFSEFNRPPDEIETRQEDKPEKPEQPQEEPDVVEEDYENPDVDADAVSVAAPQVDSNVQIETGGFTSGEYLPIVRVEPVYPTRAASRGIEGWVIVEFTVTANGSVKDPQIVEAEPSSIFNRAAERAVLKWKFKPRVVDGTPVEVPGVQTQLTFQLAD